MAKVAVLIHGCHLQAREWDNIVFGNPRGLRGRIPKGIGQALLHNAELIYWGTGASEKDGLKESQYTYAETLKRLYGIAETLRIGGRHYSQAGLAKYLREVSVIDIETQNTTEEIRACINLCVKRGINELYLVSSPTHIARCLQEALKLEAVALSGVIVYAVASDTCFADSTAADVVIIEPPHRGDMPQVPFYKTARRIFKFLRKPDIAFGFNEAWNKLIDEWEQHS